MKKEKIINSWNKNIDSFDPVPNYGNEELDIIVYMDENKHRQNHKFVIFSYDGETLLKTDIWEQVAEFITEKQ